MFNIRRSSIVKPTFRETINYGHPLAQGLVGAWLMNEGGGTSVFSFVNDNDVLTGNSTWGTGQIWTPGQHPLGMVVYNSATNGGLLNTTPSAGLKPTTAVSLFWHGACNVGGTANLGNNPLLVGMTFNAHANSTPFWSYGIGMQNGGTGILFQASIGGAALFDTAASVVTSGALASYGYSAISGSQLGYKNGRQILSASHTGGSLTYSTGYLQIGNDAVGGGNTQAWNSAAYVWNRTLLPAEHQAIAENPWCFFDRRKPRSFFFFGSSSSDQNLSPTGKASDFAAGTPDLVYTQDIGPTGKTSDFAAGNPDVQNNTINPTGKPSDFAVGTPLLSHSTLTPTGKASDFAAGAPFINLVQTIAPTGLPSAFAPGVPSVTPAKTINPTGLASAFAAGVPTVQGGPQRIVPTGLPTGFRAGNPTIQGGRAGVSIFIGGIDVTPFISLQGLSNPGQDASTTATTVQLTSQQIGRWTAVFDYYDPTQTTFPEIAQTFKFMENGVVLFSGGIVKVEVDRFDSPNLIQPYHVTAQDWSAICDRRVVNQTYFAGTDVAAAVLDIWNTVVLNPNEGITANSVPATIDTLDTNEVFAFQTVTQCFDQLAVDTGCTWWIDEFADLHFVPITTLPTCPFALTESSRNWRALSASATLLDFRSKQYVVSNLAAVPGIANQTPGQPGYGGTTVTETYTLPQAAAVARGFFLGSLVTNFPILSIVDLKVNGVSQVTYLGTSGFNFRHVYWYFSGFPFLIPPNAANNTPIFPNPPTSSPDPSNGDVLVISYVTVQTSQSAVVQGGSPLVPATPGVAGTWGSGEFDNVAQVQNINLQSDLDGIANALLIRSNMVPIIMQFETDQPGARVGQKISVTLPLSFLPATDSFMITQVQGTLMTGVLEFGSAMRWVVTATTGQDLGNSTKWFERLIARTENPLPVQQFDQLTFVLAPSGSVTSGVPTVNPKPLSTAGTLVEVFAMAGVPPTNQDLVIDILDNGVSILGPGNLLTIPAGSFNQISSTVFAALGLGVSIGDVLTVSLSYKVKGGAPTPASSVTVNVRWSTAGLPAGQSQPGVYN